MGQGINLEDWLKANQVDIHSAKLGNVDAGNYLDVEEDGTPVKKGDATTWDDLRVSPNGIPNLGANIPTPEIVANDGVVGVGNAMEYDGANDSGTVPYYSAMNTSNLTIAMWTKADTVTTNELLDRNGTGGFEFYMSNGNLTFSPVGGSTVSSNGGLITGAKQFLVATAKQEGANLRCKLYIDGVNVAEQVINASLPTNSTDGYIVGEWNSGGWNYDGIIDNLQTYNVILTDAQILELYNNGEGTNSLPTGITEATDLIMYFQDTVANMATLGSGFNYVANGGTLVDGLVGVTSGSIGVVLDAFPAGVETSKFYTMQMPHGKKLRDVASSVVGTIFNHFHWYPENNDAGDIVLGIELNWNQAGIPLTRTKIYKRTIANLTTGYTQEEMEEDFPYTTAEEIAFGDAMVGKPKQRMNNVPLAGTEPFMLKEDVSSTISARLFRAGADSEDTYLGKIYLHEFDAHVEYDTDGSRTSNSK